MSNQCAFTLLDELKQHAAERERVIYARCQRIAFGLCAVFWVLLIGGLILSQTGVL